MESYDQIRQLLRGVRARWRGLRVLQAVVRAGLSVSAVLAAAILATRSIDRSPALLALVGLALVVFVTVALVWAFAPLGRMRTMGRACRCIEERRPELDDRLATAVDAVASIGSSATPGLLEPMVADAARRVGGMDRRAIVPGAGLRQGWFRAFVVALVLVVLAFFSTGPARQVFDAAVLTVFPSRVTLQVAPGNVRVRSGSPLGITARLVGNAARVAAQVEVGDGERWRTVDMTADEDGRFRLRLDSVTSPFKYRVLAGSVTSPTYAVAVAIAPRVVGIDLDYTYPASFGAKSRRDEDSGDMYAPAGTAVQVHVRTDRPVSVAVLVLDSGQRIALAAGAEGILAGGLTLAANGSYRVALAGTDGLVNNGDTEYFIRLLEDRPPEVRILKPAADESVTPLEEVGIEAQADADRGIERLELAYAVRGGADEVVPLPIPRGGTRVKASHMLLLEDLKVEPGDFVSYYVRARDVGGTVARSDIYFLEVKPFEQAFVVSAPGSKGDSAAVDDLVAAQKEIVAATWRVDRRIDAAKGARPEQDIRSLSAGEAALKSRVEQTSGAKDEMAAAATAMGQAVSSLDSLKTGAAIPHEMDALSHLLKAQADVRRRDSPNQQSGEALFDRELQRLDETKFENRSTTEQRDEATHAALEKVKDLARRQDELLKRQDALARNRDSLAETALKRELEKLTREQSDLRQRLEDLERQMSSDGESGETARQLREAADDMRSAADELGRDELAQAGAQARSALEMLRELEQRLQASRPGERRPAGELESEARQLAEGQRQVASEVFKLGQTSADKQATQWLATEEEQLATRLRTLQERLKQSSAAGASDAKSKDKSAQAAAAGARELERQGLADRMQKSADDLRTAEDPRSEARAEGEFAQRLDAVADMLAAAGPGRDTAAGRAASELAQVQQMRERLDRMGRELDELNRQDQKSGRGSGGQKPPASNGQSGQGQGGGGSASNLERQRQQYTRDLQDARELAARVKREDPSFFDGGAGGIAGEGQGMALSAPGTEAFKQDFAKWEQLRAQATRVLEIAGTTLAERLQARASNSRLAAGADDRAPADYQKQVDSYFKALAAKKTP